CAPDRVLSTTVDTEDRRPILGRKNHCLCVLRVLSSEEFPNGYGALNVHLFVLMVYSLGLMTIGLRLGRHVRGASDFFGDGPPLRPRVVLSYTLRAKISVGP